jgi:IstB-like ATP binding protein
MDAADTADIYELIAGRHRTAATITTSNREPAEWLALMADPLLAQSAIDRLQSAAYELVLDGAARNQPLAQADEHNWQRGGNRPRIRHSQAQPLTGLKPSCLVEVGALRRGCPVRSW